MIILRFLAEENYMATHAHDTFGFFVKHALTFHEEKGLATAF